MLIRLVQHGDAQVGKIAECGKYRLLRPPRHRSVAAGASGSRASSVNRTCSRASNGAWGEIAGEWVVALIYGLRRPAGRTKKSDTPGSQLAVTATGAWSVASHNSPKTLVKIMYILF